MKRLLMLVATGAVLAAPSAHAVPAEFTATLTVSVGNFAPVPFNFSGVGETTAQGGMASIPAGALLAAFAGRVDPPILGSLGGLAICEQGLPTGAAGAQVLLPALATPATPIFSCDPGGGPGSNEEIVFDGLDAFGGLDATAYLTSNAGGGANPDPNGGLATLQVSIPLGVVGNGGVENFTVLGFLPGTLTGNPWGLEEVTGTGTLAGVPIPPIVDSGMDNRDVNGLGVLKIVTQAQACLGAGCSVGDVPTVAALTITFVPEPGVALLHGAAIAALGLVTRRRLHRKS